jgi:hypothetical protein
MKQTAVQWFASKAMYLKMNPKEVFDFLQWYEEALEMEKKQMIEVSKEGIFSTHEFEQYYKETYE